jgi:predicted nucleic acid-binding protein
LIVDTEALSAIAAGDPMLDPILRGADELAIPSIVLGEYRYGLAESRDRLKYENWLTEILKSCRVLNVDKITSIHYAQIRSDLRIAGFPIPRNDVWVAALAIQHAMPLISRDPHFDAIPGLTRVGW